MIVCCIVTTSFTLFYARAIIFYVSFYALAGIEGLIVVGIRHAYNAFWSDIEDSLLFIDHCSW
jgi:hypothetical protein